MRKSFKFFLTGGLSVCVFFGGLNLNISEISVKASLKNEVSRRTDKTLYSGNVKRNVTIELGNKKTISVGKAGKKVKWEILSGTKNISLTAKTKNKVCITAMKKGRTVIKAVQGKKNIICNITVRKHSPRASEIKKLRRFYIKNFVEPQENAQYYGYDENDDLTKEKWVSWDDYGYVRGIEFNAPDIITEVTLPAFAKIKYFGALSGKDNLKKIDLGKNKSLECFFLKDTDGETGTGFNGIESIDVSGCPNLLKFKIIDISGGSLKRIDLSANVKLESLQIDDISGLEEISLPDAINLSEVYIRNTDVKQLDLSKYKNMQKVIVRDNQVEDYYYEAATVNKKTTYVDISEYIDDSYWYPDC